MGRTSSKNHVKNYLGMQKVYADFQRLNKQMLVASKFSFSVANYSHKLHQMKAAVHGIR